MSSVSLRRVDLRLGGRTVLSQVDFDIGEREFIGVLGPNGAGKTTLMRAILGLVPIAGGELAVLGRPVLERSVLERSVLGRPGRRGNPEVGYMPQSRAAAAPRLRGRSFVAAAANGHRWGLPLLDAAARRNLDRTLELAGAASLADRPLGELSGGERQRLLLAQSLLGRPRLLLLDEPLISLDPHRQAEMVALVRRVQAELGIAVLFSAHELNPLLGALDRVLYLGGGQASIGSVDEVITAPVLSRLYGAPIEVIRQGGRIFVIPVPQSLEGEARRHDDDAGHRRAAR